MAVTRDRKAQIPAQRIRLIFPTEKAAIPQDRHDFPDKAGELGGMAEMDVEAVQRPALEPALDFIGDRFD